MNIIKAEHLGMCFGVRDAIALALQQSRVAPLTVLGDLVHNETVLADLLANGIRIAQQAGAVETQMVLITAHGASEKAMDRVRERGLRLMEATCPLVHVAHRAVAKLAGEGFHPVIVGKGDHVEVRGLTEDLADFDVVLSEADVYELKERARFGIAAQTTQPISKVRSLVELIHRRFPHSEVRFVDTVCQPTKQRQNSAVELAERSDVVVVIGGAHSNNTHELVQTCRRYCARVYHVQGAEGLREDWFEGAQTIGITAGTSTPDACISEVEGWLNELARRQEGQGARDAVPTGLDLIPRVPTNGGVGWGEVRDAVERVPADEGVGWGGARDAVPTGRDLIPRVPTKEGVEEVGRETVKR